MYCWQLKYDIRHEYAAHGEPLVRLMRPYEFVSIFENYDNMLEKMQQPLQNV